LIDTTNDSLIKHLFKELLNKQQIYVSAIKSIKIQSLHEKMNPICLNIKKIEENLKDRMLELKKCALL